MNSRIDKLVKTLLQKESLEQCSLPELEEYASRHPYFGAAQLLLAKKMQTEKTESYHEQLQKTFLFFHNPLWVEHLMNDGGKNGSEIVVQKTEPIIVEAQKPEPLKAEPKKEELLFEPFHTVDYFASQGIKIREEETPKDKLGQQLKSFTDWLKTMKRLPATEIAAAVTPVSEKKIEEMAEVSLQEREIITEAMAEVWEKQGNMTKAIDIYSKLSLLEPSKSAYFAAKIVDLKKTK